MKKFYLMAAIVGAALPLYFFAAHFAEHGFDAMTFAGAILTNKASTAFAADLLLSALVAFIFVGRDSKRRGAGKAWMMILGTCFVGLSFGLPLYLYFREAQEEAR
jgi:hypothetical protein